MAHDRPSDATGDEPSVDQTRRRRQVAELERDHRRRAIDRLEAAGELEERQREAVAAVARGIVESLEPSVRAVLERRRTSVPGRRHD